MTAPDAAPSDLQLPPRPPDAHLRAAEALLWRLADAFPAAGLGLTGSVATGTHGPESDVDLVMVDRSFRRDMQFATTSHGIRAAVVCLRAGMDAERERRWLLHSGGEMRIVSMVRSAFVARDPADVLGEMRRAVAALDEVRAARGEALADRRRADALAAIRALQGGSGDTDEHHQLRLFDAIVDGWFLRRGMRMDTRRSTERMIDTIAHHDPPLAALLRRAIPLTHAAMAPLLLASDHVFDSTAGDGRHGNIEGR